MELIGNRSDLDKDIIAKSVYDILSESISDEEALLFYKYPFYKGDTNEDMVEARLMLVSKVYGLYIFDLDNNGTINDSTVDRVDTLYNEIASRMLKYSSLRASRKNLKYDITIVLIGNFSKKQTNDDYILCPIANLATVIRNGVLKDKIPEEEFSLINSCIDGTGNLHKKKDRPLSKPGTKASILSEIQNQIAAFDVQQKKIASIEIKSPQRIRGLAGSGKTVILAYKAAIYHARHPEANILYTYYTKALGASIKELIGRAYRNFNTKDPNWEKITICHAWGSSSSEGVYYDACMDNGITPMSFGQARRFSSNAFGYICGQLLKQEIEPKYDLILIDEGQDFPVEFYRLCWKLCKTNKICWAYDDFQNIFDVKLQNEKETFGYDKDGKPYVDFSKEDPDCDMVLKKCYRTPRITLLYAFTAGLGIYYDHHVLQRLESKDQWESLGFKVEEGDAKTGDHMVISRPVENTPSYSNKYFDQNCLQWCKCKDFDSECIIVANTISKAISVDCLLPTDICVICLDSKYIVQYFNSIEQLLRRKGINTFNLLNAPNNNTTFFKDGCVTLATVNRAKGNECGMVCLCGTDAVFNKADNVVMRDRLFTSMTRTKGWLYITGCSDSLDLMVQEFRDLEKHHHKLDFIQPSKETTKNIENVSRGTLYAEDQLGVQIQKLRGLGLDDATIENILKNLLSNKK